MKPSQVARAISDCVAIQRPLMIWGPPGVGKSDSVRQAALAKRAERIAAANLNEHDAKTAMAAPLSDGTYFGLLDYRAALRDAVDVMGLPSIVNGCTIYAKPAGLPIDPAWCGIVFLDEVTSAPPQTQAALYQLTLDRCVGNYRLPDGAHIVLASNRQNDRGVTHRMPDPLADRMFHCDFEVCPNEWTQWALANSVRAESVAFIRFRPELLHVHDTARNCHAFASPRGHADVSKILDLNSPVEMELIRGRLGDSVAGEFGAFLRMYREMVSPDAILLNPNNSDVPSNPSVLYALSEALARRSTPKNFGAVMAYAGRMPKEYAQALVSSATTLCKALIHTPEFIQWASANT
jgi:hypothetical protein